MKLKIYDNLTAVVPALNEAKTVNKVIDELLKLNEINEIILVDDGSTDNTKEKIKKYLKDPRFVYIKHSKNKGKGTALKTGIDKARNEIILLLDADLQNINTQKLRKIITPVLANEVDLSRAGFRLARGRVTEIAVKPMMKILFPGVYFDQPISGQVCAKKSFLETLDLEVKWGVDIGILLDAIQAGQRIVEVDIGELIHKGRPDKEKAEMAEQVMETMIKKAGLIQHKYKLVVFTLDNTLIPQKSLEQIFAKIGIAEELDKLNKQMEKNTIDFDEFLKKSALLFRGHTVKEIEKICLEVPLIKYASEVVNALKKRKYQVAIVSSNFSPVVYGIAKRLGVEITDCPYIDLNGNKLTGNLSHRSAEKWLNLDVEEAFEKSFGRILQKSKVKPLQTLMVAHSEKCINLFLKAGFSIAFRPKDRFMKEIADKTITILPELLAIME